MTYIVSTIFSNANTDHVGEGIITLIIAITVDAIDNVLWDFQLL